MPITLNTINEAANDLLVHRLTIKGLEEQYEHILATNKKLVELQQSIETEKLARDEAQTKLLTIMADNQLKAWKSEMATFSRASRSTATINPAYKAVLEKKLKAGEEVFGWELRTVEYLSIRPIPQK